MIKKIIILFILWKIFIFTSALLMDPLIKNDFVFVPKDNGFITFIQSSPLVRMFANFDGATYLSIARGGYVSSQLGYFPLYPWTINFFSQFTRMLFGHRYYIILSEVLSNVAFLIACFFFYLIAKEDKQHGLLPLLFFVVFLYPTSFYYGAVYNDSLFLLCATMTIYFARKRKWLAASVVGALATLTRLNGLALVFLILGEYFMIRKKNEKLLTVKFNVQKWMKSLKETFSLTHMIQDKVITVIAIPTAFVGYLWYIQKKFGSFRLLFESMSAWGQNRMVFPLQTVWRYFKIIFMYPMFNKLNYWVAVLEIASVILYVFILWYSYKKIRFSYWLFMLFSLLIPALTGTFQGMPRYALHLYPFFLTIALFLNNKSNVVKTTYFIFSTILLLTLLAFFTNGYFIA